MNNKSLLLCVAIVSGLCVHISAILLLRHLPLKIHGHPFHNAVTMEQTVTDFFARQRRTEILAEVFDTLHEIEPHAGQQLHELKAEYAPAIEIALATDSSIELDIEPFSLNPDIQLHFSEEGELVLQEGSRLISPKPLVTTIEMPPLAEVNYEDDPYTSFDTLADSEHFDIEVEYAPKRYRPGYVFKITFYPRSDIIFKRICQNVFFLIDRSNSIPRARYALNKRAVSEALDYLQPGDKFNILIFDGKVVRLAAEAIAWNEENIAEGRAFLERHGHGGYFAATELYASLGKIIPQNVSDYEINTAILLSDGDTYLSTEKQRLMIGEWTKKNQGKVTLYSIASGTGNNLPLLDLISGFNQGYLLYSLDHNKLSTMLIDLLHSIQHPIGKNIVTTVVTEDRQTSVLLQPKAMRLPDLYQHRPFIVYGSINRLADFVLFLQGQYYDYSFDIKKKISFENAKFGSFTIERKWTELLSHEFYAHYIEDGNPAHLDTAKQLLVPMNLPIPWTSP